MEHQTRITVANKSHILVVIYGNPKNGKGAKDLIVPATPGWLLLVGALSQL